jgi:hypothetical protein
VAENDKIIIPLEADITDLLKDLASAGKEAGKAESKIDSLITKLKELSGTGNSNITITVNADTSQAENRIKSLDSLAPDVDITVDADTTNAESKIENIGDEVPSPVVQITADTVAAESDIENIGDNVPSPKVEVTADVSAAETDIKSLDSSTSKVEVEVTADTSDADKKLKDIDDKLNNLQKLAVIDLVLNSGGAIATIASVVDAIPGTGTILAATEAMRLFESQTGKAGKVYEDAINNVFAMNWGETQSEVAAVAARLTQAGVAAQDLEAATAQTFEVMAVTGYDAEKVIDSQNKLVANGLVPNLKAAGDLIVTGFQQGGDQAGDFLDTLTEYSSHFAALGIDGTTALNLISQGLQAGSRDSDKLADSFKELNLKLQEAVGTKAGPTFDALTKLGLFDEAQATVDGTMSGTAFAEAAIAAAETKGTDFDLVEIFGTPLEDFGVDIFKNLDFDAAEAFKIDEGTATDAATTLFDTWESSLETLKRTVEQDLAESFKIGGKPLTEILDGAKDKIQEITAELQSGKGLPEALEIVLQAPGLAKEIQRFESSLGNFLIDFMLGLAGAQEALGIGDKGANLRVRAAEQAETQLAYDIQVANPGEIQDVIKRAVSRGVDPEGIARQLEVATGEIIAEGDVQRAQDLIWNINQIPNAFVQASEGVGQGLRNIPFYVDPTATPEQIEAAKQEALAQFQADTGTQLSWTGDVKFTPSSVDVDTTAAQAAIDETITFIDNGMLNLQKTAGLITNPFQSVFDAFNTPGGQQLAAVAGAESVNAANSARGAVEGIDWSNPDNAILPPVVVEQAQQATTDIAAATTAMADTATTDFNTVQTTANETAVGLDTVVVATENMEVVGGAKIMAFAQIAQTAGQVAQSTWSQFAATLAGVQNAIPGAGAPTGDGSLSGAWDVVQATLNDMEGKAGGGAVYANTPYMVGEQGQEMFIPETDGSIIDANNTALIIEALNMIGAMQPGSTNTNTSITNNYGLTNTFNTQSGAQSVGAADALARQIRGIR